MVPQGPTHTRIANLLAIGKTRCSAKSSELLGLTSSACDDACKCQNPDNHYSEYIRTDSTRPPFSGMPIHRAGVYVRQRASLVKFFLIIFHFFSNIPDSLKKPEKLKDYVMLKRQVATTRESRIGIFSCSQTKTSFCENENLPASPIFPEEFPSAGLPPSPPQRFFWRTAGREISFKTLIILKV